MNISKGLRLYIEACVRSDGTEASEWETLSHMISTWLYQNFLTLTIGEKIRDLSSLGLPEKVEFLQVADVTGTGLSSTENTLDLKDVELTVNVFCFSDDNTEDSLQSHGEDDDNLDDGAQTIVSELPCRRFHDIWDSLIYENHLQFKLLHFLCRMLTLASRHQNAQLIPWNRVALLWGPPGTGKTSLCKALAQKIAIRMGSRFARARLVEINAHSVFSKYFGESGRIVGSFFRNIESQLENEPTVFIFLLIDEIESLVSAREKNLLGNEPRDTIRVVNSLLMALDRLRGHQNILIFCTSNIMHAMDSAFIDRVDIKYYVPVPCAQARYEILRTSYLQLLKAEVLSINRHEELETHVMDPMHGDLASSQNLPVESQLHELEEALLPRYALMQLYFWSDEQSLAKGLWNIAERCKGFSGRALRRLPVVSLAMYTNEDHCLLSTALEALSRGVEDERAIVT